MEFRKSAEKCQIILKSDPLKDAIQGKLYTMYHGKDWYLYLRNNLYVELADSLWLDSVECVVNKEPAELRVRKLIVNIEYFG